MSAESIAEKVSSKRRLASEYGKRAFIDHAVCWGGLTMTAAAVGSAEVSFAFAAGILTVASVGVSAHRLLRSQQYKFEALNLGAELTKSVTRPQVLGNGTA